MSGEVDQVVEEAVDHSGQQAEPEQQQPEAQAEAVERDVEADTLEIPDSSVEGGKVKYVPASALAGARGELRELKAELQQAKEGSSRAQQLEERIGQLEAAYQQIAPKAQAYDAALAAQQHRPQDQPQESPEDRAELEEIARDFDFYKADGALDIDKARRQQQREAKRAQRIAHESVAPLARHTVTQQSNVMLARAKATVAPNGQKPDPAVLEQVWARLDPTLTATPEGAKQAWAVALGYSAATATQPAAQATQSAATRGADGKFTKADIPDPLYTEKAGGKDGPAHVSLSDAERKYLKDAGISEKEYLESANSAPWLRR